MQKVVFPHKESAAESDVCMERSNIINCAEEAKYTNTNEQPQPNISRAERSQRKFHLGKSKKDTGKGKEIYKAEEW